MPEYITLNTSPFDLRQRQVKSGMCTAPLWVFATWQQQQQQDKFDIDLAWTQAAPFYALGSFQYQTRKEAQGKY